jgi:enamine deaminase RidA (YjgF/YER057c/UK114 family)
MDMVTRTDPVSKTQVKGMRDGSTQRRNEVTIIEANTPNRAPRSIIVPQIWAEFYAETHIPAAVRAGGIWRLTGHTGESSDGSLSDDPEAQIRQVFRNIGVTFAEAGAVWSDVVEINSYHVGLVTQTETVLNVASEFLEDPYPAWTAVGVTELIYPEAIIEISCIVLARD